MLPLPFQPQRIDPFLKPRIRVGPVHGVGNTTWPDAVSSIGTVDRRSPFHAARHQMPVQIPGALLLFHDDRPQSPAQMLVKIAKPIRSGFRAQPEVSQPPSKIPVELFDARPQRVAPCSRRQLSKSGLHPLDTAFRQPHFNPAFLSLRESEAQKVYLLWRCHRTLFLVHLQTQSFLDESSNRVHDPLTCPFAANVNVRIIGIPHKA